MQIAWLCVKVFQKKPEFDIGFYIFESLQIFYLNNTLKQEVKNKWSYELDILLLCTF